MGRDTIFPRHKRLAGNFNPRVPGGTRLVVPGHSRAAENDFNPRVPGGTRPIKSGRLVVCQSISILASRVGRDADKYYDDGYGGNISILASRVGRDFVFGCGIL